MKFSTRQDIDAPIDFVFQRASDFIGFEKQALRRGIEVVRADDLPCNATGMRWDASFTFRGKARRINAELAKYDGPNTYLIQSVSGGVEADLTVDFMALSRAKTRVIVGLDMRPRSLSARLLIQSLKFAKGNLYGRFEARVERFGKDIEEQYNRSMGVRV
ncbi:MAG: SRPBCC family protein [Paracoccaceae bacterium]